MKHIIFVGLLTAAIAACGPKANKQTTPENKGGSTTEIKGTGGQTYGGAGSGTAPKPPTSGGDPCGG